MSEAGRHPLRLSPDTGRPGAEHPPLDPELLPLLAGSLTGRLESCPVIWFGKSLLPPSSVAVVFTALVRLKEIIIIII